MKKGAELGESKNFRNLVSRLFEDSQEREEFTRALLEGNSQSPSLLWLTEQSAHTPFPAKPALPWQPHFIQAVNQDDALELEHQPGVHPLHDAGEYYCLDLSSVFQASSAQMVKAPIRSALDLCASPGGKSVFIHRLLQPEFLISNEVIRKRLGALLSNLTRCKVSSSVVSADVAMLAEALEESVDLVFVDAPCSGQSLLARGKKAPSCFHPATINMNSNRQKRILANAGRMVRPGGHLVYSTCTFAPEENEAVIDWFCRRFPHFETREQEQLTDYRSSHGQGYYYRMFPHKGEGAGGFTCLLANRNPDNEEKQFSLERIERFLVRQT